MKTHSPKRTMHFCKSLESPSVRTVRKTHPGNRPQTEKTLSVPARISDRGLIKEYRHLHLHFCLIARMAAVLGLVHTIITSGKSANFFGTRIWNIGPKSVPAYPEFSSK